MIRAAVVGDAEAIAAVYAPYVLESVATFEEVPPTAAHLAERMASGLPWLVAAADGVVGYAYAAQHGQRVGYRWSVDVSVYLAPSARGRGIGTALYDELLPLVARLGYVSAYAGIALPNDASVRLHERTGFVPVGVYRDVGFKHGRWLDVGWWQKRLVDLPADPPEPKPWDGVRG